MALLYAPQFDSPDDQGIYLPPTRARPQPAPLMAAPYEGEAVDEAASVPTAEDYARAEGERQLAVADAQRRQFEARNAPARQVYTDEKARVQAAAEKARAFEAYLRTPEGVAADRQGRGWEMFNAGLAAQRMSPVTVKSASYGPRKQYTDTMLGANGQPGLVDESRQRQQAVDQSNLAAQDATARGFEDMADRQLQAMTQLRANQQAQAEREGAQVDRMRRVSDLHLAAVDKLTKMGDVDPGRYWANAPAWQKFTAAIAAALLGWAGRTDPTAHITSAIQMDVEAQHAAIAKAQARVGNLGQQSQVEDNLYREILAQTSSQREADLTYTAAQLDYAKANMLARLQKIGITQLNDQQAQALTSLDQQIAEVKRQLGLEVVANTPTKTVMRYAGSPGERKLGMKLAEAGIEEIQSGRGDIAALTKQRDQQRYDAMVEQAKLDAKGREKPPEQQRLEFNQRAYVEKESRSLREEVRQTENFLRDYSEDIPGYGSLGWFGRAEITDEQQKAQRRLMRIIMLRLRPESGAAISDGELARESNGTITPHHAAYEEAKSMLESLDEFDVRSMLGERLDEARNKIDLIERAPSGANLGEYLGATPAEKAAIPSSTVGVPSGVRLRE